MQASQGDQKLEDGRGAVFSPAFAFNGTRLVTTKGKVASLWEIPSGRLLQRFEGHAERVNAVSLSPNGDQVLTGGGEAPELNLYQPMDGMMRLWDADNGVELRRFAGHPEGAILNVAFSPDAKRALSVGRDSAVRVWDLDSGEEIYTIRDARWHRAAAFSPDGSTLLVLRTGPSSVLIVRAESGAEICRISLAAPHGLIRSAEFNDDGSRVVTASSDNVARVWDASTGDELRACRGHTAVIHRATFAAGGQIVTCSADATIRVWDAGTAVEVMKLENPGPVRDILISPDGTRCIAKWSPEDEQITTGAVLWDLESGKEVAPIVDPRPRTRSEDAEWVEGIVGFSPDGETFLLTHSGVPESLWGAETGKLIRGFQSRGGPSRTGG